MLLKMVKYFMYDGVFVNISNEEGHGVLKRSVKSLKNVFGLIVREDVEANYTILL